MNDLQETVWSNIHCWHDWDKYIVLQAPPPVQGIHTIFCSHPYHDLVVCSTAVKFGRRFSWWKTFRRYSWWSWDNLLAENVISHCCKGICALSTKEDSHYLAPKVIDHLCRLVWENECIGTRSKDRIPFYKLLESSLLPTLKIREVVSQSVRAWMNINWEHTSCPSTYFKWFTAYTLKLPSAFDLSDLK